jgi:enoyl-CoA hydratase/carnithine racemase
MSQPISINNNGHVCSIRFNRGDKKNAITQQMYGLIADGIEQAVANSDIRVIFIGSENEHFSAGNDLADFLQNPSMGTDTEVYRFLQAMVNCPLPVVAAVQGYAVGVGSTLLLHCEQVFADKNAIFSMPFVNLGLVPEAGSSALLPKLVGYQKAADILLNGDAFSGEDAKAMGFVSQLVDADVEAKALAYAEELATKPRETLVAIKALLKRNEEPLIDRVHAELEVFVKSLKSPAAVEAMTAFMEKRKPNFEGM